MSHIIFVSWNSASPYKLITARIALKVSFCVSIRGGMLPVLTGSGEPVMAAAQGPAYPP